MCSHYEALRVASDASPPEIKQAYHTAVLRLHPDKRPATSQETGASTSSRTELEHVQAAWQVSRSFETLLGDASLS